MQNFSSLFIAAIFAVAPFSAYTQSSSGRAAADEWMSQPMIKCTSPLGLGARRCSKSIQKPER